MAITGSPDIFVSEQDLSTFVGSFDVTTAALVGDFEWGPVNQIARISNEARLKTYFGLPSDRNFKDWYTAKNYLEYSNSLALVRVCLNSARNAFFKPNENRILKYNSETETYMFQDGDDFINDDDASSEFNAEYFRYTPLSEESSSTIKDKKESLRDSTITNFPKYVAYFNENHEFTVDKASALVERDYQATPNNLLDLGVDVVKQKPTRKEVTVNGATTWVYQPTYEIKEKANETISTMKLDTVYACILVPSNKLDYESVDELEDVTFFYIRKKFENILYSVSEESSGNGYIIDFENTDKAPLCAAFKSAYLDARLSELGVTASNSQFMIIANDIELNVKNNTDYVVQEQSIGSVKNIPILAKYPGKFGNNIRVSVINKAAYDEYKKASAGLSNLSDVSNLTKNPAAALIGSRNLDDDAIVVSVSLIDPASGKKTLKEYGTFSLTKGSTDVTGYDNYVFNFFTSQSNYVFFNREAFENLYAYKETDDQGNVISVDLSKSYINIDAMLSGGEDYMKSKLSGNIANYSDVTTTVSNGIDYDINTQTTPIVDKDYVSDKTPLINIAGGVGAYMQGWDLFKNEETEDTQVQLLMQGGGSPEIGQYIIDIAEQRKDCLACVSPTVTECVNVSDPCDRIADGTGSFYSNSSYVYMDGNYKYQYDSYNDVYRWMPLNGDIAGLFAYIDAVENPWMSIGGRQLRNCIKLAFYPSKADRDVLFEHNVNPVTNFSNEGNVIWGDWTRVSNTAFNFIGVRRMFLYVEKNIKEYARKIMFNQNDQITRDHFILSVTPFLDGIVGARGMQEYAVFAGEEVTTPDEMDRGIFRAKFAIKPVRSIRYVDLVFVAIRSDMSVAEVVE